MKILGEHMGIELGMPVLENPPQWLDWGWG